MATNHDLHGKKVAILATHGFEQVELTSPKEALEQAGAEAHVIAPEGGRIRAWNHTDWGIEVPVTHTLDEASPEDYHALMLPGGVLNPDKLRTNQDALRFVQHFFRAGKPVAAICHGPQVLINAEVVEGRTMTSYPSVEIDLRNAGANWVNREVVVDEGLVTSRSPDDLEAFNRKMCEEIAEGKHAGQHA